MIHSIYNFDDLGIQVECATYEADNGVNEHHLMLHVISRGDLFSGQYQRLCEGERRMLDLPKFKEASAVMRRYFLSDSTNQVVCMKETDANCAYSYIQQPPLDGSKVAMWIYLVDNVEVSHRDGTTIVAHNGYQHLWRMGMHYGEGNSATQTTYLLESYEADLEKYCATLRDNCLRTWFFVRDVDTQYMGMVKARKENFIAQGLTEQTHYIASTGIQGLPADPHAIIQLGAYSLTGMETKQIHYLYAPSHLNPTCEYGVTFERGTVVEYGDRAHALISGTASINNKGEVIHVGDIDGQTRRMIENVKVLLDEGGFAEADVAQIIVYIRDLCDFERVKQLINEHYANVPQIFTLAPVCRPEWLVEMECIAIKKQNNSEFRAF